MPDALARNLQGALGARRQRAAGFPQVVAEPGPHGLSVLDDLQRCLARGRGVLLLTGHLGCWELLGAWLAWRLDGLAVVTATVHNPAVDRLLQEHRRALGMQPLPRVAGVRPLLRTLAANRTVGVLLDQATRAGGEPLPFFGRQAPTPTGIARLARRRGVLLVPAAMTWERDAWRIHGLPALDPADYPDDQALALACNQALERLIRRNPEQWVWFHDRWPDDPD